MIFGHRHNLAGGFGDGAQAQLEDRFAGAANDLQL
jgi:hypothetical protein